MSLEIIPVHGLPEVTRGADLAGMIADAIELRDHDVVVVTQKIVSKAEIAPGEYDFIGLTGTVTNEAWGPNIKLPGAAIDKSNVDDPKFWGNLKPPTDTVKSIE